MGRPTRTDLVLTAICAVFEAAGVFLLLRRAFRV